MKSNHQFNLLLQHAKSGDPVSASCLEYLKEGVKLWPAISTPQLDLRAIQNYGDLSIPLANTRPSRRLCRRVQKAILASNLSLDWLPENSNPGYLGMFCPEKKIVLLSRHLSRRKFLDTLIHEFSHYLLNHDKNTPRNKQEAEACWVTAQVLSYFNYDHRPYTTYKLYYLVGYGYSNWSFSTLHDYITSNHNRLQTTANNLTERIMVQK